MIYQQWRQRRRIDRQARWKTDYSHQKQHLQPEDQHNGNNQKT